MGKATHPQRIPFSLFGDMAGILCLCLEWKRPSTNFDVLDPLPQTAGTANALQTSSRLKGKKGLVEWLPKQSVYTGEENTRQAV